VLAFVLQHPFDHSPSAVQHRFREMGSHQLGTAHVAYNYIAVGVHDSPAELMTGIQPAATNLAM